MFEENGTNSRNINETSRANLINFLAECWSHNSCSHDNDNHIIDGHILSTIYVYVIDDHILSTIYVYVIDDHVI